MRKDYHMHPMVVQKPERFDAFVKKAIAEGIEEICVTDHMPLLCSDAKDRIPHGRIKEYCKIVRNFAEQYKSDITVKLGIEVDYHPSIQGEIEAVLETGEFDFILGSSHLHVVRQQELFHGKLSRNEYAKLMFENTIRAAETGYFDAIAHLDMFRWIFSRSDRYPLLNDNYSELVHTTLIDETLDAIKENGLRLEINPHFAGQTGNIIDTYPSTFLVSRALDKDISFTFGSDAHSPECVGEFLNELRVHSVYGLAIANWENDGKEKISQYENK